MGKQTKSMIGGMTVLGMTGIICKLIGVLFSVPLTWIIGDTGVAVFQKVFPTYNLLLTISSAGLPVAVSRMVSHCLTKDEPRNAKQIFRIALWMLTALGLICSIVMLSSSHLLAQSLPEAQPGFQVIAPCIILVCMLSAFRGFMQGQQNMVPTAISQLIEQVGKVFISLPLAYVGFHQALAEGLTQTEAAARGATGALLGITLMEALALGYMVLLYLRRRPAFEALPQAADAENLGSGSLAKQLVAIAIPITISACIVPLAQFVDSQMLYERMLIAGLSEERALSLYGIFTGLVIRLINIPTALALSISMSLVPAISACKAAGDQEGIAKQANMGIRFAFLIGFPCSIGMSVLAEPIFRLFYQGTLSDAKILDAASLLQVSALTVVLFTVVQATSAILQGMGKQRIPMYTLVAGVGCKILLNYLLVGTPGIDIHGGPIASLVCYSVSMIPNLIMCVRCINMKFDWMGWLVRPGIATAAMGVVVWLMKLVLPMTRVVTFLEVGVGVAVYAAAAIAVKAIRKEDIAPLLRRRKRA